MKQFEAMSFGFDFQQSLPPEFTYRPEFYSFWADGFDIKNDENRQTNVSFFTPDVNCVNLSQLDGFRNRFCDHSSSGLLTNN